MILKITLIRSERSTRGPLVKAEAIRQGRGRIYSSKYVDTVKKTLF